jgi:thiol-disulfide isomerase/thioredoxin
MKILRWSGFISALLLSVATLQAADEPTLKLGDPAPKLQVGKWVQGDPVKGFEKDKAYIVEFWATWCGPCRVSIPHLNEIHKKFKDQGLVVIGQDCWEKQEDLVEPFIKKMGDKMTYRVALDDKNGSEKGKMAENWMEAAGRNGIPSAFLVDKEGKVAWIGHPMELKDETIKAVLAGKYDLKAAQAEAEKAQKAEGALRSISTDLGMAMQKKDWEKALAKVDEAEKLLPPEQAKNLDMIRFNIFVNKEDYATAYKCASRASDANKDNANLQNQLAWQIASDPKIKERDLKLAETFAKRAETASEGKDAGILDTLARIYFMEDKKTEAVALQKKAIDVAEDAQKDMLKKTLESYEKGELPKGE